MAKKRRRLSPLTPLPTRRPSRAGARAFGRALEIPTADDLGLGLASATVATPTLTPRERKLRRATDVALDVDAQLAGVSRQPLDLSAPAVGVPPRSAADELRIARQNVIARRNANIARGFQSQQLPQALGDVPSLEFGIGEGAAGTFQDLLRANIQERELAATGADVSDQPRRTLVGPSGIQRSPSGLETFLGSSTFRGATPVGAPPGFGVPGTGTAQQVAAFQEGRSRRQQELARRRRNVQARAQGVTPFQSAVQERLAAGDELTASQRFALAPEAEAQRGTLQAERETVQQQQRLQELNIAGNLAASENPEAARLGAEMFTRLQGGVAAPAQRGMVASVRRKMDRATQTQFDTAWAATVSADNEALLRRAMRRAGVLNVEMDQVVKLWKGPDKPGIMASLEGTVLESPDHFRRAVGDLLFGDLPRPGAEPIR